MLPELIKQALLTNLQGHTEKMQARGYVRVVYRELRLFTPNPIVFLGYGSIL